MTGWGNFARGDGRHAADRKSEGSHENRLLFFNEPFAGCSGV